MKTAIVTGASSGIGLTISHKLLQLGYRVIGLARDFSKASFEHEHFQKIQCDITKLSELCDTIDRIKNEEANIYMLVNNAGVGYFAPHEQLKAEQIAAMVATNLQAPLILSQLLLRNIKEAEGYIINISSITAKKVSTHGCAYAATKAGLTHFGTSLFEEIRKSGAKVVTLHPDLTETPFYDQLDFRHGDHPESFITSECIADAVETILTRRSGTVITEMVIRPQKNQIIRKPRNKKESHLE